MFTYPGDKRNSGIEDATIVATHLMLAAYNEGVDSCWINFFNPDELAKAFNLPEDEEILMLLDLGVADKTTTPLPNHNSINRDSIVYLKLHNRCTYNYNNADNFLGITQFVFYIWIRINYI